MKVFCRYLRKRLHHMLILVFSSIAVFVFFLTLSAQFKFICNNYQPLDALFYALEVLPVNLYKICPLLLLLGLWVLFYRLHAKGELMQMYAAGVTPVRIATWLRPALFFWLIMMVLVGECAGPLMERHAKKRRMQAMLDYHVVENDKSLWLKEPYGFIQATRTESHKRLIHLKRYFFQNDRLVAIESIPEAVFYDNKWQLVSGEKILLHPTVQIEPMAATIWKTSLTPELLGLSSSSIHQRPLYQIIPALRVKSLGLFTKKDVSVFWGRLFQPVQVGLLASWLSLTASRICLWRLAQHTIYHSLLGCLIFCGAGFVWRQLAQWMFAGIPYVGDMIVCIILISFIYRGKRTSMQYIYTMR